MSDKNIDNETDFKKTIVETIKALSEKHDYLKNLIGIVDQGCLSGYKEINRRIKNIIFALWGLLMMILLTIGIFLSR